MMENPSGLDCASLFLKLSREEGLSISDKGFAQLLDERDPLKWLRSEFHVPTISEVTENDFDYKGSHATIWLWLAYS